MRPAHIFVPTREPSPLDVWCERSLKDQYEPVLHEKLPPEILRLLPPPPPN